MALIRVIWRGFGGELMEASIRVDGYEENAGAFDGRLDIAKVFLYTSQLKFLIFHH